MHAKVRAIQILRVLGTALDVVGKGAHATKLQTIGRVAKERREHEIGNLVARTRELRVAQRNAGTGPWPPFTRARGESAAGCVVMLRGGRPPNETAGSPALLLCHVPKGANEAREIGGVGVPAQVVRTAAPKETELNKFGWVTAAALGGRRREARERRAVACQLRWCRDRPRNAFLELLD